MHFAATGEDSARRRHGRHDFCCILFFCWNHQSFLLEPTFVFATSEKTTCCESATGAASSEFFCYIWHKFLLEPARASATTVGVAELPPGEKNATTGASNCYGRHFYLLEPVKSRRGGASSSDIICYIRHQFLLEPARVPDGHTTPLELLPRAARMLQPATEVVMTTPATLRRHTMLGDGDVFVLHRTQQGLLATTATC